MDAQTSVRSLLVVAMAGVLIPVGERREQPRGPATDPPAVLARMREAIGFGRVAGRMLHYQAAGAVEQNYQSDRTYPPFFSAFVQEDVWFDPARALLRIESRLQFPGSPAMPPAVTIDDGRNAATTERERSVAISRRQATGRMLSAWAVVADWSAASDVRFVGTEIFRDYPRAVLERRTREGIEKLYVDLKSGFPVKLDLVEPHYLWGQRHIEYLWSTWVMQAGIALPGAAFRLADGAIEISQTIGAGEIVERQAAPALEAPEAPTQPPSDLPLYLQAIPPKTTRVSANTVLISNPGYTEAVTVVGRDVFVFDATQSEDRARQDAEAIAALFPGPHTINLVVTDLAWPHIGGVRYWVSQGATVHAHAAARGFLEHLVNRRWSAAPDTLERKRQQHAAPPLKFVAVQQPANLAGGAIRLAPIDGIGSEVTLMAYVAADRFLWASDYIQTLREPTLYAAEVMQAADRLGIVPERVAAQHLPLSDWNAVLAAQAKPSSAKSQ